MSTLTVGTVTVTGTTGVITGALRAEGIIPVGAIIWFANTSTPTGYLRANGAAVSRTTYAALFTAIGTTYGGGDGSTTFNLPDLRGEFIRALDDGRGVDSSRGIGTSQAASFASHSHRIAVSGADDNNHTGNFDGVADSDAGSKGYIRNTEATQGVTNETRPRNVAMLACIKF